MNRKIQEQHDVFYENDDRVLKGTVPPGWTYVTPGGHDNNYEVAEKYVDNILKKENETSCLIFDMVAELAMWQADLAI
eukprot:2873043-Amphidinium_carterae.1